VNGKTSVTGNARIEIERRGRGREDNIGDMKIDFRSFLSESSSVSPRKKERKQKKRKGRGGCRGGREIGRAPTPIAIAWPTRRKTRGRKKQLAHIPSATTSCHSLNYLDDLGKEKKRKKKPRPRGTASGFGKEFFVS